MAKNESCSCGHNVANVGGQAVIEGVMMRGPYSWAVSARDPQGFIHSEEFELTSGSGRHPWMGWPLIRGVVALVESLQMGVKALTISAYLAGTDDDTGEELSSGAMATAIIGGAGLAIFLFIVLPAFLTNLILGSAAVHMARWNALDGFFRLIMFFLYIWIIGYYPDLKRLYRYHGAEHKTIHALEAGEELTPENVRKYSCLHVRCGTAFLVMLLIISIIIFSLIPLKAMVQGWGITNKYAVLGIVILSRIILLPIVAGISYEITVKWAGPRADNPLVRLVLWPGLQMQRLTTAEPDDQMVECAIASTNLVVERIERVEHPERFTDEKPYNHLPQGES